MTSHDLIFKALADPTRQRLLRVLLARELSVSELVEVLDQPQSTVSRHLKVLRESGLVVDRRAANIVLYATLPPSPAGTLHAPGAGNGALRDQLLEWLRATPMDTRMAQRLDRVLDRRQTSHTAFFDDLGERWDQLRVEAFGECFHLEALASLLPREWTVADLGTGTGYLLSTLATQFDRLIAVDASERMLAIAAHRLEPGSESRVEFRRGSLTELPLSDGEVDLVVASLVLHHVEEPQVALREIRRCIRPTGRVLMIEQEPHQDAGFHEGMADRWWGFAPGELTCWVEQAGFGDVRHHPLRTAQPTGKGAGRAPRLYVLTAQAATAAHTNECNPSMSSSGLVNG